MDTDQTEHDDKLHVSHDRLYRLYLEARTKMLDTHPIDVECMLAVAIGCDRDAALLTRADLVNRVRHGMTAESVPGPAPDNVTFTLAARVTDPARMASALAKPIRHALEPALPWKAIQDAAVAAGLQAYLDGEGRLVLASPRRYAEPASAGNPAT